MNIFDQIVCGMVSLVAAVNDGQVVLPFSMVNISPVIYASVLVKAKQEQQFGDRLLIDIPGTVHDLQTLQQYIIQAKQSVWQQPGERNLPTLITVGELAMELEIPRVVDLVTYDMVWVLELEIDDGHDVKDYPWLNLCHLTKKARKQGLLDRIAWCFLNTARATHSVQDALWAFEIGQTVLQETGFQGVLTNAMYLCVIWGALSEPNAPRLPAAIPSAIESTRMILESLLTNLASTQMCDEHDLQACKKGRARRRCVDHWRVVWQKAHQAASGAIHDEYRRTSIDGAERDILRMLRLIHDALWEIARAEAVPPAQPTACDLKRLHATKILLLGQQGAVKSLINQFL